MKDGRLDSMEFNTKKTVKRSKVILSELDELEDEVALPSSLFSKSKSEKKNNNDEKNKTKSDNNNDELDEGWMATLTSFKAPKTKKKAKSLFDGFDTGKKKKAKKKEKDGEAINHKKDFEPELVLLRNLQMDQNRFVDSLQKKYDQFENTKSTARGVGKYTTDLINAITSARSVSMQLVDKIISTKKTVADLNFKERKEFGSKGSSEQQNLANYASTYLKQMMTIGRTNINGQSQSYDNYEYNQSNDDVDDLFSSIDESLGDSDRDEDVEKYLKYENDNVQVKVIWYDNRDDNDIENKYDYIAYNDKGEVVDDYPLPEKTKMSINRSTETATDLYGNKYKMEIVA